MNTLTDSSIKVRVLFFAQIKDCVGRSELDLNIVKKYRVSDLIEELGSRFPEVLDVINVSRVAVNLEFASPETVLKESDEVAVIPPVSGG